MSETVKSVSGWWERSAGRNGLEVYHCGAHPRHRFRLPREKAARLRRTGRLERWLLARECPVCRSREVTARLLGLPAAARAPRKYAVASRWDGSRPEYFAAVVLHPRKYVVASRWGGGQRQCFVQRRGRGRKGKS